MSAHERSYWRDRELSLRHRKWGFNAPMTDIDFLAMEYNRRKAVAIIEYKMEPISMDRSNPSIEACRDLCDRAGIYFFVVSYTKDFRRWRMQAGNEKARRYLHGLLQIVYSERDFVTVLYHLRRQPIPDHWVKFDEDGRLIE